MRKARAKVGEKQPVFTLGRRTSVARLVSAGCLTCNGSDGMWFSANGQAVAARHHDATGHPTWADVTLMIKYGKEP